MKINKKLIETCQKTAFTPPLPAAAEPGPATEDSRFTDHAMNSPIFSLPTYS